MSCKNMNLKLILQIFLLAIVSFIAPALAQPKLYDYWCDERAGNYTANSTYQTNLQVLLPYLTTQSSLNPFGNITIGAGVDQVYMLYNCRGDQDGEQCHNCVQAAAQQIVMKCPIEKEAIVWYDECILRYANRTIFSREEENVFSLSGSSVNVSDPGNFDEILSKMMFGLTDQAAYNASTRGYAVGDAVVDVFNNVYCYVQCTPDILGNLCERCLKSVLRSMAGCCGMSTTSLRFVVPSCQIQYDTVPFILGTGNVSSASPLSPDSAPAMSPDSPYLKLTPGTPSKEAPNKGGCNAKLMNSIRDLVMLLLMMTVSVFLM